MVKYDLWRSGFVTKKKIGIELLAKTYFGFIKTYLAEGKCDMEDVNNKFKALKRVPYDSSYDLSDGKSILDKTYESIILCHDFLVFKNVDKEKNNLAVQD